MPWAFLGTPIKSHAIIIATSLSGVLQPMTSEAGCNEVLHLFSLKLLASLGTLVCLFYFLFSLKVLVPLALLCAPTLYPSLTYVFDEALVFRYGLGFDVRIHWGPLVLTTGS